MMFCVPIFSKEAWPSHAHANIRCRTYLDQLSTAYDQIAREGFAVEPVGTGTGAVCVEPHSDTMLHT